MSELLDQAEEVVRQTMALGAEEATASISRGTHTTLSRRAGKVEQATQATSRGLSISLMVDGRWSGHSTSDLRPEALQAFLERAVEATRYMEEDPDRRLPDPALCGRGVSEEQLDQDDPAWYALTADERADRALRLEQALDALADDAVISSAVHVADGQSDAARVMSTGFADESRGAWFSLGGETTLRDADGRRPEASAWYGARHLADLPDVEQVANEVDERARERLGSRSIESGTWPLVLHNRAAGRILGVLGGPLSGGSLHERRSCLADRKGTRIGSERFTLLDDPTIPRGLGSRPWDGDGLIARPLPIVEGGVLQNYYIGVYYGRKLGMDPTTGSRSNWIVPAGERSWQTIAAQYPKAILVNGFLGGNSNPTTGDFSFGIRGVLLEHGVPTRPLSEMNVSGNVLTIFERLAEVADDPWEFSAVRSPTLVFEDVQFSGT